MLWFVRWWCCGLLVVDWILVRIYINCISINCDFLYTLILRVSFIFYFLSPAFTLNFCLAVMGFPLCRIFPYVDAGRCGFTSMCIVGITISRGSFVFIQSRVKGSTSLTAAFHFYSLCWRNLPLEKRFNQSRPPTSIRWHQVLSTRH